MAQLGLLWLVFRGCPAHAGFGGACCCATARSVRKERIAAALSVSVMLEAGRGGRFGRVEEDGRASGLKVV